jgi:hypothetical protein
MATHKAVGCTFAGMSYKFVSVMHASDAWEQRLTGALSGMKRSPRQSTSRELITSALGLRIHKAAPRPQACRWVACVELHKALRHPHGSTPNPKAKGLDHNA